MAKGKNYGAGRIPAVMRIRNPAQQALRKYNAKKNWQNQNRQQVVEVLTHMIASASKEVLGMDEKAIDAAICPTVAELGKEYEKLKLKIGEREAVDDMKLKVGGLICGWTLPCMTRAYSLEDTVALAGQKRAGELCMALWLLALREKLGCTDGQLMRILVKADLGYRDFLEMAKEGRDELHPNDGIGQAVAYEKLAEMVSQEIGENVCVETLAGAKPVFVEKFQ